MAPIELEKQKPYEDMAPKVIELQTKQEEMAAPAEDCGYAYPIRTITVETNEFRMFNPILTEEPGP